jgi:uncharacterized membrane protein
MISRLKSLSPRLPSDVVLLGLAMVLTNVSIILANAHGGALPVGFAIISLPIILVAFAFLTICCGRIFDLLEDAQTQAEDHSVISIALSVMISAALALVAREETNLFVGAIHGAQIPFALVVILHALIEEADDENADDANAESPEPLAPAD